MTPTARLSPPRGLRPAELGLLLRGRVLPRDLAATVLDLQRRGFLLLTSDDGDGWTVTRLRPLDDEDVAAYETLLVDGILAGGHAARVGELGPDLLDTLEAVDSELGDEAMRRGWLRRWHRRRLTADGERLVGEVRFYRHTLRRLAPEDVPPELTPYLMAVGAGEVHWLPPELAQLTPARDMWVEPSRRYGGYAGFLAVWQARCDATGWSAPDDEPGWSGTFPTPGAVYDGGPPEQRGPRSDHRADH